jgi:hypothetical protein
VNTEQIAKYINDFELTNKQMQFIGDHVKGLEESAANYLISEVVGIILASKNEKPNSINDAWSQVEFALPVLRAKLDMIWHTCWSCAHTETENHCDKFNASMSSENFKKQNPCQHYKFDNILDE